MFLENYSLEQLQTILVLGVLDFFCVVFPKHDLVQYTIFKVWPARMNHSFVSFYFCDEDSNLIV